MPVVSTYTLVKRLDADITRILAASRAAGIVEPALEREMKLLKRDVANARLDIRDYELAETKIEQVRLGSDATKRLEAVRHGILAVSQNNVFGAVEVAQLSAQIESLIERL